MAFEKHFVNPNRSHGRHNSFKINPKPKCL